MISQNNDLNRPAHIPQELVRDFDFFNIPGVEMGAQQSWMGGEIQVLRFSGLIIMASIGLSPAPKTSPKCNVTIQSFPISVFRYRLRRCLHCLWSRIRLNMVRSGPCSVHCSVVSFTRKRRSRFGGSQRNSSPGSGRKGAVIQDSTVVLEMAPTVVREPILAVWKSNARWKRGCLGSPILSSILLRHLSSGRAWSVR